LLKHLMQILLAFCGILLILSIPVHIEGFSLRFYLIIATLFIVISFILYINLEANLKNSKRIKDAYVLKDYP